MKPKHLIITLIVLLMVNFAQAEFIEKIDETHQWLTLVFAFFYIISLVVYILKCCNPFGSFCAEKGTPGTNNKKDYHLDFIELDTI